MPTKDPHIALIDAHEALERVKLMVRTATELARYKAAKGETLTLDDHYKIKAIRAEAIERTKRIQDWLCKELEGHGKLA